MYLLTHSHATFGFGRGQSRERMNMYGTAEEVGLYGSLDPPADGLKIAPRTAVEESTGGGSGLNEHVLLARECVECQVVHIVPLFYSLHLICTLFTGSSDRAVVPSEWRRIS